MDMLHATWQEADPKMQRGQKGRPCYHRRWHFHTRHHLIEAGRGKTNVNAGWENGVYTQPVTLLIPLGVRNTKMTLKSGEKKLLNVAAYQHRRMHYGCSAKMRDTAFVQNYRHPLALWSFIQKVSAIYDNFHTLEFANENSVVYRNGTVGLTFQF